MYYAKNKVLYFERGTQIRKMELTSSYCAFGLKLFSSTNSNGHKKKLSISNNYMQMDNTIYVCFFPFIGS